MMSFEDMKLAVKRGAAVMDRLYPEHYQAGDNLPWWQVVDPDKLVMNDPMKCVLGQAYGDYHNVSPVLAGKLMTPGAASDVIFDAIFDTMMQYGFVLAPQPRNIGVTWPALGDAWAEEIQARREADLRV